MSKEPNKIFIFPDFDIRFTKFPLVISSSSLESAIDIALKEYDDMRIEDLSVGEIYLDSGFRTEFEGVLLNGNIQRKIKEKIDETNLTTTYNVVPTSLDLNEYDTNKEDLFYLTDAISREEINTKLLAINGSPMVRNKEQKIFKINYHVSFLPTSSYALVSAENKEDALCLLYIYSKDEIRSFFRGSLDLIEEIESGKSKDLAGLIFTDIYMPLYKKAGISF